MSRSDQGLVAVFAGVVILIWIIAGLVYLATHPAPPPYCPPEWQCVGPPDTRALNCSCLYDK